MEGSNAGYTSQSGHEAENDKSFVDYTTDGMTHQALALFSSALTLDFISVIIFCQRLNYASCKNLGG
jgi:hypothetical protein